MGKIDKVKEAEAKKLQLEIKRYELAHNRKAGPRVIERIIKTLRRGY